MGTVDLGGRLGPPRAKRYIRYLTRWTTRARPPSPCTHPPARPPLETLPLIRSLPHLPHKLLFPFSHKHLIITVLLLSPSLPHKLSSLVLVSFVPSLLFSHTWHPFLPFTLRNGRQREAVNNQISRGKWRADAREAAGRKGDAVKEREGHGTRGRKRAWKGEALMKEWGIMTKRESKGTYNMRNMN